MRVTKKSLSDLVDELLAKKEIPFRVKEIIRSRFRPMDYERGAYVWKAKLSHIEKKDWESEMTSFVWFYEIQDCLNKGGELTLEWEIGTSHLGILSDINITIKGGLKT